MKKKEWLILGIITIIAGVALGCTHLLTRDSIANQEKSALNAARFSVTSEASDFVDEPLVEGAALDSLHRAVIGEETIGYVGQATVSGFGGPIVVVLGVDNAGAVTGISVGGSAFAETAGIGTRTREPEFTDQFKGLTSAPVLKDNVDSISGATVSCSAVTTGANKIYQYIYATMNGGEAPVEETAIPITAADQRVATVKGFVDEIEVKVGVQPDGSIEAIEVGGPKFNETAGMGALAKEPAFINQFAGKTGPLSYGADGLDVISGATITSDAVLKAINDVLGFEEAVEASPDPVITVLDTPNDSGTVKLVAETVQGFKSEIVVTVGMDANGVITELKVGGPKFDETEYYGAEAQSNTFRNQFIGKTGPLSYGVDGVDALSGSTITSDAVLKAINEALTR